MVVSVVKCLSDEGGWVRVAFVFSLSFGSPSTNQRVFGEDVDRCVFVGFGKWSWVDGWGEWAGVGVGCHESFSDDF